ncbi:hypothetical protein Hdeb2414_s0007g00252631 [Helianthus debilis subsp. tardiflorus]
MTSYIIFRFLFFILFVNRKFYHSLFFVLYDYTFKLSSRDGNGDQTRVRELELEKGIGEIEITIERRKGKGREKDRKEIQKEPKSLKVRTREMLNKRKQSLLLN